MGLQKWITKKFNSVFNKNENMSEDSSKEGLKKARQQDQKGNYDIDGASFDGENVYIGSRMKGAHVKDTP